VVGGGNDDDCILLVYDETCEWKLETLWRLSSSMLGRNTYCDNQRVDEMLVCHVMPRLYV
jgi:hypothetical protein